MLVSVSRIGIKLRLTLYRIYMLTNISKSHFRILEPFAGLKHKVLKYCVYLL